ncbi:MAG: hypothetical protein ACLQJR_05190 [Stellaceae bacterium]
MPRTYLEAKLALAALERVDEAAAWADKAAALSSYARQVRDRELEAMARRIRARAIRRCGELLRLIPECRGRRRDLRPDRAVGARTQAATDAGLSESQYKLAIRLSKIEAIEFEAAIEAPNPPGCARLAGRAALRPPPVNADADGGFQRARGFLSALVGVYRSAPPRVRQKIRDMIMRAFGGADPGDDSLDVRLRPSRSGVQ